MMWVFLLLFVLLLILKAPIAICMIIPSLYYIISNGLSMAFLSQRMTGGMDSYALLSIPLYIFAGYIMNTGKITDRIFDFVHTITRHVRGGLGYANVINSFIFSGMSGSACADAGSFGNIEITAMLKHGYSKKMTLAITGASSTIGPIFPPSSPMIILAFATSLSLGKLFMAGVLPGILMAVLLCVKVAFDCRKDNLPKEPRASFKEVWTSFKRAFFSLIAPIILLILIYSGVFTATETAAGFAAYALILAIIYKAINVKSFFNLVKETIRAAGSISVIVAGATLFGWVLTREKIPQMLVQLFTSSISSKYVFFILCILFYLILGCIIDDSVSLLIVVPMLLPVATSFGIDPIHFCLVSVLALMIGLLTPPVGLVLFMLQKISDTPYEETAKAVFPYVVLYTAFAIFLVFVPWLSTWIPNMMIPSP